MTQHLSLSLESVDEARALLRSIVASKFTEVPADPEVLTSHFVARIASELYGFVAAEDGKRWGDVARQRWIDWRAMTRQRPEWTLAARHCVKFFGAQWKTLSESQKRLTIESLFSPFKLSHADLETFILQIDDEMRDDVS